MGVARRNQGDGDVWSELAVFEEATEEDAQITGGGWSDLLSHKVAASDS